jgi:hypothetical protein
MTDTKGEKRTENHSEVENISIEIKYKDGDIMKIDNPKTMLLVANNIDVDEIKKELEENKNEEKIEAINMQIVGKRKSLNFAFFCLLQELIRLLGSTDVIDVINQIMVIEFEKHQKEHMIEHVLQEEKPRTKN